MEYLFTVIIPVHNAEKYIGTCLQSLVRQTDKRFQVIIIDDASTDDTLSIIEPFLQDKRFELIKNEDNLGAAQARNLGMQMIKGKYVKFLDADDYLYDNSLEIEGSFMQENELQLCFLELLYVSFDGCMRNSLGAIESRVYSGDELLAEFVRNRSSFLFCCGAIYQAKFIKEKKLAFTDIKIGEGGLFILSALLEAEKASILPIPTYCYRQHQESITKSCDARVMTLFGQMYQYEYARERLYRYKSRKGLLVFLNYQYGKVRSGLLSLSSEEKKILNELVNQDYLAHLSSIILDGEKRYNTELSEGSKREILFGKPVILFGCGYATVEVLQELSKYNANIIAIATSKDEKNKYFWGHRIVNIRELVEYREVAIVIVGVNIKYKEEIENELVECGFNDYEFLEIKY